MDRMLRRALTLQKKAKNATFLTRNKAVVRQAKATATFTPIDFTSIGNVDDLNGKVVGKLKTSLPTNVTGLPPGIYSLYLSKSGSTWHGYFVSGAKVSEAGRVEISQPAKPSGVALKAEIGILDWHLCVYDHWVCLYR